MCLETYNEECFEAFKKELLGAFKRKNGFLKERENLKKRAFRKKESLKKELLF